MAHMHAVGQHDYEHVCNHAIASEASCKCQQHADNVTNASAFACFADMLREASHQRKILPYHLCMLDSHQTLATSQCCYACSHETTAALLLDAVALQALSEHLQMSAQMCLQSYCASPSCWYQVNTLCLRLGMQHLRSSTSAPFKIVGCKVDFCPASPEMFRLAIATKSSRLRAYCQQQPLWQTPAECSPGGCGLGPSNIKPQCFRKAVVSIVLPSAYRQLLVCKRHVTIHPECASRHVANGRDYALQSDLGHTDTWLHAAHSAAMQLTKHRFLF